LDRNALPVSSSLCRGSEPKRIFKLKMDEKYTWNLTWQHKDKVLVFHGICVQPASKEVGLFAIHGDTKGNKKM